MTESSDRCEVCYAADWRRERTGQPGPKVASCPGCRTIFNLSDTPVASGVVSAPPDETVRQFKGYDVRPFVGSVYDRLTTDLLKPGRRILDIGCFDGRFLAFARERGCEPWGLELQSAMAEFCTTQGLSVFSGRIPEEMPDEITGQTFEIITAIECTCYWKDWDSCMSIIRRLLTPGGHLMIKLNQGTSRYYDGSVSWSERVGNFHAMLNLKALGIIAERHGLRIVRHLPLAYIFDRRRYHPSPLKRLFFRNWLRLKSVWAATFWPPEDWDKVVILFQKKQIEA